MKRAETHDALGERRSITDPQRPFSMKFAVHTRPRETQAERLAREVAQAIDDEDDIYIREADAADET